MKKIRKWLFCVLIFLFVLILGFFCWNIWQDFQDKQISDAQIKIKPEVSDMDSLSIMDFSNIQAQNPDIAAWLTIQQIGIDYPIVQATDNKYYLDHTAQCRYNKLGSLFLDYRVNNDFSDFNSVIYGHNMTSGQMFGQLERMKEQTYFDTVTTGVLYTPGKTYRLKIFAVSVAGSESDYYRYAFPSNADKEEHLNMIGKYAKFHRDVGVKANDRLLLLSTCSYEYKNARTLVIAKLCD